VVVVSRTESGSFMFVRASLQAGDGFRDQFCPPGS